MSILIRGGRIIDPANDIDQVADLYVAEGKIVALGASASKFTAETTIDATGLIVCPGFVDTGTRIPEPGFEHKGTVASETRAAAAGGYTSLCCTPDTNPIIDTPSVATLIQDLAHESGSTHIHPIGALTPGLSGDQLSEMHALREAGCVGLSNLRHPFTDNRVILRCLEYAKSLDITVFLSPTDVALEQGGCAHRGSYASRLGLAAIPESAETVALARDLLLIEQTGVRAHLGPLSCARSVELVADAQARGLAVTADVAIHHLLETEAAIHDFNSLYHLQPPLRSSADRAALRDGVKGGVISVIRSDHCPHEAAAKMAPFAATEPGISSIETLLPQALSLVNSGVLELNELIHRLSAGPAQITGLAAGTLGIGQIADICVFSEHESWELNELTSQGKNSPLLGKELKGRTHYTITQGKRVFPAERG